MILVCPLCSQRMNGQKRHLKQIVRCPGCKQNIRPKLPAEHSLPPVDLDGPLSPLDKLSHAFNEAYGQKHPPEQSTWYVHTIKGKLGPFTSKQIIAFARQGKIVPRNHLQHASSSMKVEAGQIPDLFVPTPQQDPGEFQTSSQRGWYVKTIKGELGPFNHAQIVEFARQGKITRTTQLRHGISKKCILAGNVQGLTMPQA